MLGVESECGAVIKTSRTWIADCFFQFAKFAQFSLPRVSTAEEPRLAPAVNDSIENNEQQLRSIGGNWMALYATTRSSLISLNVDM